MSIYCPLSEALGIEPPETPIDYDDYTRCVEFDYISIRHTAETRDAIRNALRGKSKTEEHKNAMRKPKKRGYKQTEEHKDKRSSKRSREWNITKPDGSTTVVRNLSQFCRENGLKHGQSNLIHGWSYKGYRAIRND